MLSAFLTLLAIELKMYIREPTAIFWTFLFPILLLLLMMVLYGHPMGAQNRLLVFFHNSDDTASGLSFERELSKRLNASGVDLRMRNERPAQTGSFLHPYSVEISVPAGFNSRILSDFIPDVKIVVAGRKDKRVLSIIDEVRALVEGSDYRFSVNVEYKEKGNTVSPQAYLVCGLIGMTIVATSFFGMAVVLVQMRSSGAFKMYQVMPIPRILYLASFILSRLIVIWLFSYAFILLADQVYALNVVYDLESALGFTALVIASSVTFLSIGVALASRTANVSAANGMVNLVYFPLIFLSGIFYPVTIPIDWIQSVMETLPLKGVIDGFYQVIFSYNSSELHWQTFASLFGWLSLTLLISAMIFRWHKEA